MYEIISELYSYWLVTDSCRLYYECIILKQFQYNLQPLACVLFLDQTSPPFQLLHHPSNRYANPPTTTVAS